MLATRFARIAVIWFVLCVALGVFMGATHNFTDVQAHVHGNLLGWVSCFLFALAHRAWPTLSESKVARAQFWLHNLGLPVFIAGLLILPRNANVAEPVLGISSLVLLASALAFAYSVWKVIPATSTR